MAGTNDVQAFIPSIWSKRTQLMKREKSIIYAIANFEEREGLKFGAEVFRPFMMDDLEINQYTRGKDGKEQTLKTMPEKLLIDQENEITVYIDTNDQTQSKYSIEKEFSDRASNLKNSSLLSIRLMVELLTKLMLQISFLSLKTSSLSIM